MARVRLYRCFITGAHIVQLHLGDNVAQVSFDASSGFLHFDLRFNNAENVSILKYIFFLKIQAYTTIIWLPYPQKGYGHLWFKTLDLEQKKKKTAKVLNG